MAEDDTGTTQSDTTEDGPTEDDQPAGPGLVVLDGQLGDVMRWHAIGTGDARQYALTLGVRMSPGTVRPVARYTALDAGALAALLGAPNALRITRAARDGRGRGTLEGVTLASRTLDTERVPHDHATPVRRGSTPEPNTVDAERERQAATDAERQRRETLRETTRAQFRVEGNRFRFKDGTRALAFTVARGQYVTASNDPRAARGIAALADADGATGLTVSGHKDFRREVWIEAEARGITVRGYKPTEQDRSAAEKRAAEQMTNRVAPHRGADKRVRGQAFDAIAAAKTRTPEAATALRDRLHTLHDERVAGGAPPLAVAVHDPAARSASLRRGVPVKDTSRTKERGAGASA